MKRLERKVWLASPTMHGDELRYMKEAFDTNWMSTIGENIDEVEKQFGEMLNRQYAVALSSGTAALHLAIRAAGYRLYGKPKVSHGSLEGKTIFCSDMTFSATVNPVIYEGGIPIFIDSEFETWNMDPIALEEAFHKYPETKLVVVANLYGTPAKLEEIAQICHKHEALLIEDAAESLGATVRGRQTGTFGDYNCISFNGNKIITGSAGGMFLTYDKDVALQVRKWSTQSREPVAWYQHEELGYNYRMSNVIAGVVRGQIPYLQEHIEKKKEIYHRYKSAFEEANLPITMNPIAEGDTPNYWLSCARIDDKCDVAPEEVLHAIESINAEGRPIWKPMHMQPFYKDNPMIGEGNDEKIFAKGLCLPSDNKMTEEEQLIIIEVIKHCFKRSYES